MSYLINLSLFRRNRNFALLYLGQFISLLGTMITSVALPYQIYHQTNSIIMVGLLSFTQLVPLLFTALIGGVFADRYHRRRLLILAELMLTIGCLLLALNAFSATPSVTVLFVIAATMSALNGLHRPALESIVQQIVPKKDFHIVSALSTFKFSVAMIGGPAIGGMLIAHFGLVFTYLFDFFSFFVSLMTLFLLKHLPSPVATRDESILAALKSGFKYALSRQELIGSYLVDFTAMVFSMPNALFPAFAERFGGPQVLGLLYAGPAIGALFISFASGWTHKITHHGRAVAISAIFWAMGIIGFGLSSHFLVAFCFLIVAGAFDALSGIFRSVLWNETIPYQLRGRMSGIEMISYLSGPRLGETGVSFMAATMGLSTAVVCGGFLSMFGVMICCYLLPKFWHYQSITAERDEHAYLLDHANTQ